MIKPKALKYGDTIGIIAPASSAPEEKIAMAEKELEKIGFNVKLGESCFLNYGYLSGKDEIRAYDLNNMFYDNKIDGILCLRGGYGTLRILDMIDYKMIKKNPKIFVGYSDITALHIALNQKSSLITFHGPMAASDIANNLDEFSKDSFINAITNKSSIGKIINPENEEIKTGVEGMCIGEIIGGNLALITSTIGTQYEIITKGKILFLEDIGEEPYRIDRMLTQLKLSGKLDDAVGIILGDFKSCEPKVMKNSFTLSEVFKDILYSLNKPLIYNIKAGHCSPKLTIPFGVKTVLDGYKGELIIEESATIK